MKPIKFAATFLAVLAMLFVSLPSARASTANQLTRVTIDQPVQIPHRVLPAGTYWFVLPETGVNYNPNVVAIYNANRTHLIAMLPSVPTYRMKLSGHTRLSFAEQNNRAPDALLKWFYPGDHTGHAFLYSAHMQKLLSADNVQNVRARNAQLG
jgi:hypothetical protein